MLVCAGSAFADATERVANGGFEDGTTLTAPPWTFTDANPCSSACGLPAASGARYASSDFGFGDQAPPQSLDNSVGSFEQSIVVPEAPAKLSFKFRFVDSPHPVVVDRELAVSLGGTVLTTVSEDPSTDFEQVVVSIPSGKIQMAAQTLKFEAFCSNLSNQTVDCDRADVDDVSLVTGSPPDAPTITGTDPPSPANNTNPTVKGTVPAGDASQVNVYTNATCAGAPAASGTVAQFTGAGIRVTVPDGSSTAFSASAANEAGDSACSNSITYVELGSQAPPGGGPPGGTGPDVIAAVLSRYALFPPVFVAANLGGSIAQRRPVGTRVSYTLSEPATVTFRVERGAPGRRVRGRCRRPSRRNRRARRCVRYVTLPGRFAHAGQAGSNRFTFTGRLRGRSLRPGAYRLAAGAVDAAGNRSRVARKKFRVVR